MVGGFALGSPLRDAALHGIFLGFVVSMIFGHAPIILAAVAKIRMAYSPLLAAIARKLQEFAWRSACASE